MEPMGFEPTPSAVQMRPEESASVRSRPESAANTHILMVGAGPLVRPVPADIAWVGVRLVSRPLSYSPFLPQDSASQRSSIMKGMTYSFQRGCRVRFAIRLRRLQSSSGRFLSTGARERHGARCPEHASHIRLQELIDRYPRFVHSYGLPVHR